MVEWHWQGKTEVLGDTSVPLPLWPLRTSHGLTWDWTFSMLREWIKKRHSDLVMKQDWKRKIYIIGQCNWNETTGLAGFRLEVWKPGCDRRGAEKIILLLCAKKKRRVWFKNNRNYSYFFKIVYWVLYYYYYSFKVQLYQRFSHCWKHFWNSSVLLYFKTSSVFFFTSLTSAKRCPFVWRFVWGNRKKSHGARSGE